MRQSAERGDEESSTGAAVASRSRSLSILMLMLVMAMMMVVVVVVVMALYQPNRTAKPSKLTRHTSLVFTPFVSSQPLAWLF